MKKFTVERKHKLINCYELDEVKKMFKSSIDTQVEFTGINLHSRVLIVGGSGTGKTNFTLQYLIEASKPKGGSPFEEVILVYKTDEKLYNYLKTKLGASLVMYKNLNDLPDPEKWEDQEVKDPKDRVERLIIFDDFVADKDQKTLQKLAKYCQFGRKKGLTQFFLTQSYYETTPFMRLQMNYLIMLNLPNKRNLKSILTNLATNIEYETLEDIVSQSTSESLSFCKIDLNASTNINKKFSVGFLDYFEGI